MLRYWITGKNGSQAHVSLPWHTKCSWHIICKFNFCGLLSLAFCPKKLNCLHSVIYGQVNSMFVFHSSPVKSLWDSKRAAVFLQGSFSGSNKKAIDLFNHVPLSRTWVTEVYFLFSSELQRMTWSQREDLLHEKFHVSKALDKVTNVQVCLNCQSGRWLRL